VTAEDADDEEPSEQAEAEVSAEEAVDADSVTAEDADDEEPSEQAEAETPAEKTPTKSTQEDGSEAATEEN